MPEAMLEIGGLQARYGITPVLFDMNIRVNPGEFVTLLGRNGMGKTTTVRSILGQVAATAKTMVFNGTSILGWKPEKVAQAGIGLVPEGRQIFPTLTVRENLVATAANRLGTKSPWTLDRVNKLFPRLKERENQRAGTLSGGEQQMLAVGRALMTNPRLLILDEATEGLAPLIREEIWKCLTLLKQEGQAILVIDKNVYRMLPLADRHFIVEKGHVVWEGTSAALSADINLAHRYLGV